MSARIAIAGGGPTGLMMARLLAADGHDVTVYEASGEIGGLCRTREVDGYTFDVAGGHIMYTKDERVFAFWRSLFSDEPLVEIERDTRILHRDGTFVSYPFENGIGELPLEDTLDCAEGLIRAMLERGDTPPPEDFASWIRWKMGDGMARHFMTPYNEKIWKSPLDEMSSCWVEGRVPDAPPEDVLRSALGETTAGYTHQAIFRYPRHGGFAAIHERIARPILDRVERHHRVESIVPIAGGREGWKVDGETFDHVISTIALHDLPGVLEGMEPAAADAARRLRYRGVATYLVGIPEEMVRPYCWLYLPHREQGPVNRMTYLSNYSPNNAPTGKGSVLAEVTYAGEPPDVTSEGRRALAKSLDEGAGLIDADAVEVTDAALNPVAYILYDLDFTRKRACVLEALDAMPGLHAIGRFGRYNYHNSDHCLAACLDLHEQLAPVLANGGGPEA